MPVVLSSIITLLVVGSKEDTFDRELSRHAFTHIQTAMHTFPYTHIHMNASYSYMITYIHTYTHIYIHTYIHMYTYIHTNVHACTYTHIHTHTCTHCLHVVRRNYSLPPDFPSACMTSCERCIAAMLSSRMPVNTPLPVVSKENSRGSSSGEIVTFIPANEPEHACKRRR